MGRSGHSLGRSGHPYTPPPGSVSGDVDRATLCPMGSRCPGLNVAFLDAFGSDQGSIKAFNTSSIRQTQICSIDHLDLLYIMHKFNCYICAYLLNTAMSTAFSVCLFVLCAHFNNLVYVPRCYNSGFSISGSSRTSLYLSAICCAVCCGMPCCCPTCTGAVSAIP